jgi:hypothetical protein
LDVLHTYFSIISGKNLPIPSAKRTRLLAEGTDAAGGWDNRKMCAGCSLAGRIFLTVDRIFYINK